MARLPNADYRIPPGQLLFEGDNRPEVSVVVPVYYNAESLGELYRRLVETMSNLEVDGWDVTFVNDGSKDRSREVLENLRLSHDNVRVVHMAKNHGSDAAVVAGMSFVSGRSVAVLAADLQDPPEVLAQLVPIWRSGVPVVIATRNSRQDPITSRIFSAIFYRLFRWLVTPEMPPGGFDLVLMDEQVASILVRHAEKNMSLHAALLRLGFDRSVVGYHRAARPYGSSRWTFWRKFKLMYDSILSYSYRPLRLVTAAGVLGLIVSVTYASIILYYHFTSPPRVPGWASLMLVTLFFDGLVLTALGIVGEYIWRAFDAARPWPTYVVRCHAEPRQRVFTQQHVSGDEQGQTDANGTPREPR